MDKGMAVIPEIFICGIGEISIDASSIIYMLKTGILGYVSAVMDLLASPGVIEEVGWPRLPVRKIPVGGSLTNDDTVLFLAEQRGIPLISEDMEILEKARKKGIPYFNTLMILNYLLFRKRVSSAEYSVYLNRLTEVSRYSRDVLEYGAAVKELIEREIL